MNAFKLLILLFFFNIFIFPVFSQSNKPKIIIDEKLSSLVELKKEVNNETFTSGQYTIQIFSGNYEDGLILMEELEKEKAFDDIYFSFETPYYKIRIGKFVSKLDAIKNLKHIKQNYSSAFILRPNWYYFDFFISNSENASIISPTIISL